MTEPEQQAFSIYELICTTSANRPITFRSSEQAQRETAAWQATDPGLQAMRSAPPEVLLAFLRNYKGWRTATDRRDDHKMSLSMGEALHIAIVIAPKPLPPDLVLQLLRGYGSGLSWMLFRFPLRQFLALLTRLSSQFDGRVVGSRLEGKRSRCV